MLKIKKPLPWKCDLCGRPAWVDVGAFILCPACLSDYNVYDWNERDGLVPVSTKMQRMLN